MRVTLVEEMVLELGCFGKCLCIYPFNYDTATSLFWEKKNGNWKQCSKRIILKASAVNISDPLMVEGAVIFWKSENYANIYVESDAKIYIDAFNGISLDVFFFWKINFFFCNDSKTLIFIFIIFISCLFYWVNKYVNSVTHVLTKFTFYQLISLCCNKDSLLPFVFEIWINDLHFFSS